MQPEVRTLWNGNILCPTTDDNRDKSLDKSVWTNEAPLKIGRSAEPIALAPLKCEDLAMASIP